MLRIHVLECEAEHYQSLNKEAKNFVVRLNDRDYKVGDILWFYPYDPETEEEGEGYIWRKVTYIQPGRGKCGVNLGYCVMALTTLSGQDVRKLIDYLNGLKPPKALNKPKE
ncbi:MAG: DUF3850 domain-containing protein [Bacteroidota bacterium]